MNVSLTLILLLAGAGGEGKGFGLQAQLGYEPAVLLRGDDFKKQSRAPAGLSEPTIFYALHPLRCKIGTRFANGIELRAIGSYGGCRIKYPKSLLYFPLDSLPLNYYRWGDIKETEYSIGGELGYSFRTRSIYWPPQWDVYVGLESVWGEIRGYENWVFYETDDQEALDTFYFASDLKGLQGHLGIATPIVSYGRFSLQIHGLLKGGAVKEQSLDYSGLPPEAEMNDHPRTLLRWGLSLALTVNYSGGKQQ